MVQVYPRLDDDNTSPVTLVAGQQIINAQKNSRLQGLTVSGKTMINQAGTLSQWNSSGYIPTGATVTLDTTKDSLGCLKVTQTNDYAYIESSEMINVVSGEYYVVLVDTWNESSETMNFDAKYYNSVSISTSIISGALSKVEWKTVANRIRVTSSGSFRPNCQLVGVPGNVMYFRNLRVFKITSDEYTNLATTPINEVAAKYHWSSGINSLEGLYARRYGKNLLPSKPDTLHANMRYNGSYDITLKATAMYQSANTYINVLPNTIYTIYVESTGGNIWQYKANGSANDGISFGANSPRTFTTQSDTYSIRVEFTSAQTSGTLQWKNWMLVLGDASMLPSTFIPREDSLLAFSGVELHSSPVDGSNPDVLSEIGGQYIKHSKWKKIVLDGSLPWEAFAAANPPGIKRVFSANSIIGNSVAADNDDDGKVFVIKGGSGISLKNSDVPLGSWSTGDLFKIYSSNIYITIDNTLSGWGNNYTPSNDEIKAYFNGWKMFDAVANPNGTGVYNRTDGLNKAWAQRRDDGSFTNGIIGNSPPNYSGWINFKPYQLLYLLSNTKTEQVQQDGSLSFIEGNNFVEVGSGYVSRERANPNSSISVGVPSYHINDTYWNSQLKNKVEKFVSIYKNGLTDPDWEYSDTGTTYGKVRAYIPDSKFNISATYSVSYIKLNKFPVSSIVGYSSITEKSQIKDIIDGITESISKVSVVESKKRESDSTIWLKPTLINGWITYGDGYYEPEGYSKDSSGVVRMKGLVKGGSAPSTLFYLPNGYRPKYQKIFDVIGDNLICRIDVKTSGAVVLSGSAGTMFTSLDGIEFKVD